MPWRAASSATVALSREASSATFTLNAASNFRLGFVIIRSRAGRPVPPLSYARFRRRSARHLHDRTRHRHPWRADAAPAQTFALEVGVCWTGQETNGRPSGWPLAISRGHRLLRRRTQAADLVESGRNARVDLISRLLAGLDQDLGHVAHCRDALLERALAKFRFLRGKLGG